MIQWIIDQVNWLIRTATDSYRWIVGFINNPYPVIANLLNWVYQNAVNFAVSVKSWVVSWVDSLIGNIWDWLLWLANLYNNEIAPRINSLWNTIQNVSNNVWERIKPIFDQAVANLWSWIVWLDDTIKIIRSDLSNVWLSVQSYIAPMINKLISDVNWLITNFQGIDLSGIYTKMGDLYRWVYDFDIIFYRKLGEALLEILEEKLAEAME